MSNTARFSLIVCFIACVGSISSCNTNSKENFIENFGNFMSEINNNSKNYSEADWQAADEQFNDFKDNQFPMWEDLMSPTEKKKINEMIGKYQAMQVKRGMKDLKNQVENAIDQTKTMFNELSKDTTLMQ